jgi:meso-butanediol dehydrogenase / (S,S)-butanediol dehydrogenase / diacetyl reductase
MSSLMGRVVLITGAARGIGEATARRLAGEGAKLVLADINGASVEKLAGELGQVAIQVDVTREADIARMVDEPYRRHGRLDVLFNNAGVVRVQPMLDVTREEWDRVMDVNLRAVFFGGNHLMTPYSATKAGVVSLTRSAAQALASHRITSNCVCPGAVETAMWEQIDKEWGALEGLGQGEAWKRRIRGIPLGRPERAEDVAGVVAFLAGADSDYMTGQAINVDGGIVMGN